MPPERDDLTDLVWRAARWEYSYEDEASYLVSDGWYRDPRIVLGVGRALGDLHADKAAPTVVVGPHASGHLLGPLVAAALGVGFVRAVKNPTPFADSDRWLTRTTPPDYRDRHMVLGWRDRLIGPGDRVLCVDDITETGGQLTAVRGVVESIGATWVGAAVVADLLTDHRVRRDLGVRSMLTRRHL